MQHILQHASCNKNTATYTWHVGRNYYCVYIASCVTVGAGVLQCIVRCCSHFRCVAVHCLVCCSRCRCVAVQCKVLQSLQVCCSKPADIVNIRAPRTHKEGSFPKEIWLPLNTPAMTATHLATHLQHDCNDLCASQPCAPDGCIHTVCSR